MQKKRYSSLENALRILELFSLENPELKLTDVARSLSVSESTAHRLLSTLKKEGFIAKDPISNSYRLGVYIRSLEAALLQEWDLYHIASPILEDLSIKTGETVSLCTLFRNQTFYIHTIETTHIVFENMTYNGKLQNLDETSAGFALISSDAQHEAITKEDVADVKEKGYAISYNNFSSGLTSIAAPVKNKTGKVLAAVELIGPEQRIEKKEKQLINDLIEASINLQKSLATSSY